MTADEARKLTEKAKSASDKTVTTLLNYIHGKIVQAAKSGSSAIYDPLLGLRLHYLPADAQEAYEALRKEGYLVGSRYFPSIGADRLEVS